MYSFATLGINQLPVAELPGGASPLPLGERKERPGLCILTAAAASKWRDRPESAELQSYINGRHDIKNDVKIYEILRDPTLISKASSKASSLQRYLQSWCKYPFVTMMSQLFAQQKATNPHGGAANHQVLRSPKGCGSVESLQGPHREDGRMTCKRCRMTTPQHGALFRTARFAASHATGSPSWHNPWRGNNTVAVLEHCTKENTQAIVSAAYCESITI